MTDFVLPHFRKFDFTLNLSDRIIMKFPHCDVEIYVFSVDSDFYVKLIFAGKSSRSIVPVL